MFKWLKKKGIDFAASYLKSKATVDNLQLILVDLTDTIIAKAVNGSESQMKLAKTCTVVRDISEICALIANALEDGKITVDETATITQRIYSAVRISPLSDDKIAKYIDSLAEEIKAKV